MGIRLLCYLSTPGGLTGGPRRLLTLAKILDGAGVEVCVATQQDSKLIEAAAADGHYTASLDTTGVLALRQRALFVGSAWFRIRVVLALLRQNLRFWRCVHRQDADAVWIRSSKGIAFAALGTVFSRRPLIWDVDFEPPSKGAVRWLHRLGLWAAEAVVFQYEEAAYSIFGTELANRYHEKFYPIIPGIDLASVEKKRRQKTEEAKENEGFVILQVGTICDRKNQALTLEALSIAQRNGLGRSWELWLAFDENQDPDFERQVEKYDIKKNVKFLGWRDDVKELMTQSNVLAMSSKDEGVPNAVQEAMALGLPVLVSPTGGMPEIVEHDHTGWILDAYDPDAWADKLLWCQKNGEACETVGKNASEYAFEHFGTEKWGAQYAQVIRDVVRIHGKGQRG